MLSTRSLDLSVVVPAFNEEARLSRALPALIDHLDVARAELIVVDDGSTDATAAVARAHLDSLPHGRVVRLPANLGKGGATRIGVSRARGAAVVFMDADLATDPAGLRPLLSALEEADVAIGSRAHAHSEVSGSSRSREWMGRGFNLFSRVACGFDHRDTQCGFKGFRAPAARVLFHLSRINGFAFDVELLLLAGKLGLRVHEVPIRWTAMDGSTVRPLRDPAPMALDVVRSRVRWRGRRPIAAITADTSPDEASDVAAEVRGHLRQVDPVVTWERGAVALLPCTDRARVTMVAQRLRRKLPGLTVEATELAPAALVPASGGLLRTALAA